MRERTVNEDQHFERGRNPKTSMGIGGINLLDELSSRIDELEYEIGMSVRSADEEWKEWLSKTLVGKTITAKMTHHPAVNTKSGESIKSKGSWEFTIKVQDALPGDDIAKIQDKSTYTAPAEDQNIIVADMDNNIYSIKITNKIHID